MRSLARHGAPACPGCPPTRPRATSTPCAKGARSPPSSSGSAGQGPRRWRRSSLRPAAPSRTPKIQDLLNASHGGNLGLRYPDSAFNFDAVAVGELVTPELAALPVWLDAFVTNPDRTHRNPNLMIRERRPWPIDYGAALYAHHDWARVDEARTRAAFPLIRTHVLLDRYLRSLHAVATGDPAAGPVAFAPSSERFHWPVAPRSDVLQCSPVHEGVGAEPAAALAGLFAW